MPVLVSRTDLALLSLEGLSLGDAFGETFFTDDAEQRIHERRLREGRWRWTDDTAMALSIVETLVARGSVDQDVLARRFAARYAAEPARGYAPATHRMLSAVHAGAHWHQAATSQQLELGAARRRIR
jgi:ADP-ribosylglycohydrolase